MSEIKCPNCQSENVKLDGKRLVCESCDAVFKLTGDGARVQKQGVLDNHEERLARLESLLPEKPDKPEPEPEPEQIESDKNKDEVFPE